MNQVVPINTSEERVSLHTLGASADVAQAARAVYGAEGTDNILRVFRKGWIGRENDGFLDDSDRDSSVQCQGRQKRDKPTVYRSPWDSDAKMADSR